MNEQDIVARIARAFASKSAKVGIGDDAAVVGEQVFTTDMLIEDVDFTRSIPLSFVARKSLAVNLSDIAAMGARPQFALLALGLPPSMTGEIDVFLQSLAASADRYGVEIIGGDLSRADKMTIAITMVGMVVGRILLRSGAKPGHRLYLSRPIGGAGTGLALLQSGWSIAENGDVLAASGVGYAEREFGASAIRRQVDPEPEVDLGMALSRVAEVSSCIDVSDGLSTDLHHLCRASGCGAELERERIPIFPDLLAHGPKLGAAPRDVILHGGEEYALLFTSSLRESELSERLKRPVYGIGRMTAARDVLLVENGMAQPLEARGFDHFR